jgi:hypothetical protein
VLLPLHVHVLMVLQVHLMVLLSVHLLLLCCQVRHGIPASLLLMLRGVEGHVAITLKHHWLCLGHHGTRMWRQNVALLVLHASW